VSTHPETPRLNLVLEFSIGADPSADPAQSFVFVRDMHITEDGRLWVLDDEGGIGQDGPYRLRIFDQRGDYVQSVGRTGSGPGEYGNPIGIAELPDGRIALRDIGAPPRVSIYDSAGEVVTSWRLPAATSAVVRGRSAIDVDVSGRLWLFVMGRPSRHGRLVEYQVYTPEGELVGKTPPPALPEIKSPLELTTERPNGAISRVSWRVPFSRSHLWGWGPAGIFATINTAEYRVTFVPASGSEVGLADGAAIPGPVTRQVSPVVVSDAERQFRLDVLRNSVMQHPRGAELRIPGIPSIKPPLAGVSYTQDGRLLVRVSVGSEEVDGDWLEPLAYDLFDKRGELQGRIRMPPSMFLGAMSGDRLCGYARDVDHVESVRCYRVIPDTS
jgi:hypothetical protein